MLGLGQHCVLFVDKRVIFVEHALTKMCLFEFRNTSSLLLAFDLLEEALLLRHTNVCHHRVQLVVLLDPGRLVRVAVCGYTADYSLDDREEDGADEDNDEEPDVLDKVHWEDGAYTPNHLEYRYQQGRPVRLTWMRLKGGCELSAINGPALPRLAHVDKTFRPSIELRKD